MDFLDPEKQKAHARRLLLGYVLIGLIVLLGTTILLYLSYGFGLDKNGKVIQNGLVFLSSQPDGATIYINGQQADQTNTRLTLPAGSYIAEIRRTGYSSWKRAITVEGGSVERFDYPFLYPAQLVTTTLKQYTAAPGMTTQSPDRRWLLVNVTADQFDLYDLSTAKPTPKQLAISSDMYAAASVTKSWEAVQWDEADRYVILKRTYEKAGQAGSEYLLVDRDKPEQSVNLTLTLGINPTTITMRDGNYDQYYLFDENAHQLLTATLKKPTPQSYIKDVLAFKADKDQLLYATPDKTATGKVQLRMYDNNKSYLLRTAPESTKYLLNLAKYNGNWLVAAGSQNEDKVYVYKNPLDKLKDADKPVLVPVQILKLTTPQYVSFGLNGRYVMIENAGKFAVYDAERDKGYASEMKTPFDTTQAHAEWMDGYRLTANSNGKLTVFDYDGANANTLMPLQAGTIPFFDHTYGKVYAFNSSNALTATALLTPADQ
jgi:hypothetical protein